MENVVLTVHLLLALGLIGVVLLQRSEGGGLGLGGGGGGGIMSGRSAASALSKVTWILAVAFIITSLGLTVLAARNSAGSSVVDRIGIPDTAEETCWRLLAIQNLCCHPLRTAILPSFLVRTSPLSIADILKDTTKSCVYVAKLLRILYLLNPVKL